MSHEHQKNQTALSKQFWRLKNKGLTPEIQWTILKRSYFVFIVTREFFALALAGDLSLKTTWQQVSPVLLYSSQYSCWSLQCCYQDSFDSPSDFQFLQSLLQAFGDRPEHSEIYVSDSLRLILVCVYTI